MSGRSYDAGELARTLLAEMAPAARAEFLAGELGRITDLTALTAARNHLTRAISEMIAARYEAP